MNKLLIANWKMNPRTEREAVRLARASDARNVVIAPPFPFLPAVGKTMKRAMLGAQDVFWEEQGAFTGEISASQLKSLGVQCVIIGHSERRALGETDAMVNKKVRAALRAGLTPILCVGEPLSVRRKGLAAAKRFVKSQLASALKDIRNSKFEIRNLLIAYEPLWAIGTGRSDKPKDIIEMVRFIKKLLVISYKLSVIKVLYGGSVTSKNVRRFLKEKVIDGALVGGASLKPREFKKMIIIAGGL